MLGEIYSVNIIFFNWQNFLLSVEFYSVSRSFFSQQNFLLSVEFYSVSGVLFYWQKFYLHFLVDCEGYTQHCQQDLSTLKDSLKDKDSLKKPKRAYSAFVDFFMRLLKETLFFVRIIRKKLQAISNSGSRFFSFSMYLHSLKTLADSNFYLPF